MKTPSLVIIIVSTLAIAVALSLACGTTTSSPNSPPNDAANSALSEAPSQVPMPDAVATSSAAATAAKEITDRQRKAEMATATSQRKLYNCFTAMGGEGALFRRNKDHVPVAIQDLSEIDVTDYLRTAEIEEPRTNWVHLGGYPREWRLLEFGSEEWETAKLSGLTNFPVLDYCPDHFDEVLSNFSPEQASVNATTTATAEIAAEATVEASATMEATRLRLRELCRLNKFGNNHSTTKWEQLDPDEPFEMHEGFEYVLNKRWCEEHDAVQHARLWGDEEARFPTPIPAPTAVAE